MNAARISRPSSVRIGIFCRLGFADDSLPGHFQCALCSSRMKLTANLCASSYTLVDWLISQEVADGTVHKSLQYATYRGVPRNAASDLSASSSSIWRPAINLLSLCSSSRAEAASNSVSAASFARRASKTISIASDITNIPNPTFGVIGFQPFFFQSSQCSHPSKITPMTTPIAAPIIPTSLRFISVDYCDSLCRAERAESNADFRAKLAVIEIVGIVVGLIGVVVIYHLVSRNKNENSN